MRFAFIRAEKAHYPVTTLCRVLQVSTSGFYAWLRRKPSARELRDRRLRAEIATIHHEASRKTLDWRTPAEAFEELLNFANQDTVATTP